MDPTHWAKLSKKQVSDVSEEDVQVAGAAAAAKEAAAAGGASGSGGGASGSGGSASGSDKKPVLKSVLKGQKRKAAFAEASAAAGARAAAGAAAMARAGGASAGLYKLKPVSSIA